MVIRAQLMDRVNQGSHVIGINFWMDTVAEVEYVAVAMAETSQHFRYALPHPLWGGV